MDFLGTLFAHQVENVDDREAEPNADDATHVDDEVVDEYCDKELHLDHWVICSPQVEAGESFSRTSVRLRLTDECDGERNQISFHV